MKNSFARRWAFESRASRACWLTALTLWVGCGVSSPETNPDCKVDCSNGGTENGGSNGGTTSSSGGKASNGGASAGGSITPMGDGGNVSSSNGGMPSAAGGKANDAGASSGGAASNAGASARGGTASTGGTSSRGGATSAGGSVRGGAANTGGAATRGGAANGGGVANTGGTANGGGASTGGAPTNAGGSGTETVGSGSVDAPALGPAPTDAAKAGGAAFTLVKNWNFGSSGTIRNISELSAEFMYHDQFGTIGNGTNYGAITVAPSAATAISGQPVEDPARPYREFTADSMKAYVRPLSATQSSVSVAAHNAGNGSITAKWTLASGGKLLGKDLLWETRVRMPVAAAAYWFAIWTAGNKWDGGAEMDVLESFGTPNIYPPPAAFHVNSVGGSDTIDYSSWPNGLNAAGVPSNGRDLREYHVFTWLYRKDDSYVVYYDGHVVQSGKLLWTLGGTANGEHINMSFLFDFGWGHTKISDVNISLPASTFAITYEVDYSRVYLR